MGRPAAILRSPYRAGYALLGLHESLSRWEKNWKSLGRATAPSVNGWSALQGLGVLFALAKEH